MIKKVAGPEEEIEQNVLSQGILINFCVFLIMNRKSL